jgi:toxin secretion/phage lysis holin
MGNDIAVKTGFAAFLSFGAIYLGYFGVTLWIMAVFAIMDYLTGIVAAIKNAGLTSQKAFWGAVKKISFFVLVGVAFGVDYMIDYMAGIIGWSIHFHPIGIMAICYLISTEAISILENLAELGVEVPLLSRTVKSFRDKIDAGAAKVAEDKK